MKFVLVPVLIMLLLTQTFSSWVVVFEYKLNRDFVARNLCINKAKPKMHCHGKCQMMKRLAEEEKQNSPQNTNTIKLKIQELVFNDEMSKLEFPSPTNYKTSYNEYPPILKMNSPASSIFHPPALG
jgi:hypothetical protein